MINVELLTAVTLGIFLAGVLQTSINYGIGKITYKKRKQLLAQEFESLRESLRQVSEIKKEETTK